MKTGFFLYTCRLQVRNIVSAENRIGSDRLKQILQHFPDSLGHQPVSPVFPGKNKTDFPAFQFIKFGQLLEEYPELADYAGDPSNFTESIVLDGKLCYIAYYGTVQPGGHFTRERTFAVASDQSRIYEYDTAGDIWYHTVY